MTDQPLFIAGATGALGKRLVQELLETTESRLYLLARPRKRLSAEDRVRKILAAFGHESDLGTRVEILEGDVTTPGFGLSEEDLARLRREVVQFYHVAALTDLAGSAEDCRRINVGGSVEALRLARDLAESGRLERLCYFSTAYVAGSLRPYESMEDELNPSPAHANHYESSKYEAERLVRAAMAEGLPVTIFRPSIVVGDSRTGEITQFNVIYPFMKLFAHGILEVLPARPDDAFNIVPIDFVTRAIVAIAARPDTIGKTFHLVTQRPPSIGTLLHMKDVEFPTMPHVALVDPSRLGEFQQAAASSMVLDLIEPYLGYLRCQLTFDTTNARQALQDTDVRFPETDYQFLERIVRYAVDQNYLIV